MEVFSFSTVGVATMCILNYLNTPVQLEPPMYMNRYWMHIKDKICSIEVWEINVIYSLTIVEFVQKGVQYQDNVYNRCYRVLVSQADLAVALFYKSIKVCSKNTWKVLTCDMPLFDRFICNHSRCLDLNTLGLYFFSFCLHYTSFNNNCLCCMVQIKNKTKHYHGLYLISMD